MTTFKHQNFTKEITIKETREDGLGDKFYDIEFWRGLMVEPSLVIHTDKKTIKLLLKALKRLEGS